MSEIKIQIQNLNALNKGSRLVIGVGEDGIHVVLKEANETDKSQQWTIQASMNIEGNIMGYMIKNVEFQKYLRWNDGGTPQNGEQLYIADLDANAGNEYCWRIVLDPKKPKQTDRKDYLSNIYALSNPTSTQYLMDCKADGTVPETQVILLSTGDATADSKRWFVLDMAKHKV